MGGLLLQDIPTGSPARRAVHREITPVEHEHGVDALLLGDIHQHGVGELGTQQGGHASG